MLIWYTLKDTYFSTKYIVVYLFECKTQCQLFYIHVEKIGQPAFTPNTVYLKKNFEWSKWWMILNIPKVTFHQMNDMFYQNEKKNVLVFYVTNFLLSWIEIEDKKAPTAATASSGTVLVVRQIYKRSVQLKPAHQNKKGLIKTNSAYKPAIYCH